jgi:hypothetical protein
MSEYRTAYVPETTETDGVITHVTSGEAVEVPATDPSFRERYPHLAGQAAVQKSMS